MWRGTWISTFAYTTFAAAGLAAVAGCADAVDDGTAEESVETRSQPLLSATAATDDERAVELSFRHTAADGWRLETAPPNSETQTVRQRQYTDEDDGVERVRTGSKVRFSGESRATVRFFGSARHSSRFRGTSDSQSRYRGTSGASSRFEVEAGGSAIRSCDPTALCDFAETVCRAYPRASGTQWAESCAPGDIQRCKTEMRRTIESRTGSAFACLLATVARCAERGIASAGSVSSEAELERAARRGLERCSVDGDLEFEAEFEIE